MNENEVHFHIMVVVDSTTLNKIYFQLEDTDKGYDFDEDDTALWNTVVAKDVLTIVCMKCNQKGETVQKSVKVQKSSINAFDIVEALVKCETQLRKKYSIIDWDHVFFEGFFCSDGDSEIYCVGWGS